MPNRIFARIEYLHERNEVVEIIEETDMPFENQWMPDFVAKCVEITNLDPLPKVGWIKDNGMLVEPPPYVIPPDQEMKIAVKAGCTIHSTGTSSLNATYDAYGPRWQMMRDEIMYIAAFDSFSGGLDEFDWVAMTGEVIFTTTNQFKAVAKAIGDWLTGWQRYVDGKSNAPPASVITIA